MLLPASSVVFAAEDPLKDAYVEELAKFLSYDENIYNPENFKYDVIEPAQEMFYENFGEVPTSSEEWDTGDRDAIAALIEAMKEVNSMIESKIANGEATIVVNTIACARTAARFAVCYNDRIPEEMIQHITNSELGKTLGNKILEDEAKLHELIYAGTCTQADYDELMA